MSHHEMPRARRFPTPWIAAGIVPALVFGCGADPEPGPEPVADTGPGLVVELPDGESDAFGPLPLEVAGWRVTRGAAAGYVDDAACKDCHADIFASYQEMGMARSLYRADPDSPVEKLGEVFHHEKSKRYYRMVARDGKYVLQRYCKDAKGNRFAEYEAEVEWVIGSGNHVRTYLSRSEYGELRELPLSWYAESGWGMSPGYDRRDHLGFERDVDRGCMFCHNAYPELPVGGDLHWAPKVFPKEMPHGIGCQRCHGPGARHVEAANREDSSDEEIRARIVDPADFPEEDRDQLCMTCHLQPESLVGEMMPRHHGKPMYQLRPGEKVTDHIGYLDHGTEAERRQRIEVNHHAYRMRWSRCFTASEGKLACVTCHDPHKKVPKAERAEFYRKKCFGCHEVTDCEMEGMGTAESAATADCVSCHMVKARPSDVVMVTITDHLIRRHPPEDDLAAPREEVVPDTDGLQIVPYFPEQAANDPRWELYAGFGRANADDCAEDMRRWRAEFERTRPHTVAAYIEVGRTLQQAGSGGDALAVLTEGVAKFPDHYAVRWAFGDALWGANRGAEAVAQLEIAHRLAPDDPGVNRSLADAYAVTKQWQKARVAYEASLRQRPANANTLRQYAYTLLRLPDLAAAERALLQLIALDPDDPYAYDQLASILATRGEFERRITVLEQGASRLLEIHLLLAMDYFFGTRREHLDPRKGYDLARQAVIDHPDDPRSHQYFATAMLMSDSPHDASPAIKAGDERGGDPACSAALWGLHALRLGQFDEATRRFAEFAELRKKEREEPLRAHLGFVIDSLPPMSEFRKGGGRTPR